MFVTLLYDKKEIIFLLAILYIIVYYCTLCCQNIFGLRHTTKYWNGKSSNGRIPAFEAVCPGSNPGFPSPLVRGGETVSRRAHNPETAGSTPAPASTINSCNYNYKIICAEVVELVDTPGLGPGAVWCAGSTPVLGNLHNTFVVC